MGRSRHCYFLWQFLYLGYIHDAGMRLVFFIEIQSLRVKLLQEISETVADEMPSDGDKMMVLTY